MSGELVKVYKSHKEACMYSSYDNNHEIAKIQYNCKLGYSEFHCSYLGISRLKRFNKAWVLIETVIHDVDVADLGVNEIEFIYGYIAEPRDIVRALFLTRNQNLLKTRRFRELDTLENMFGL